MKTQKGMALAMVMFLVMVMFTVSLCLSLVVEKNLNFFHFYSNKETTRSLARAAISYMIVKGSAASLGWHCVADELFATDDIKLDPEEPYYFKIQDTNHSDSNSGEYQFIGIIKDISGAKEISRTVLRVQKSPEIAADIKKIRQFWKE